jgi:hypothetical protein
MVYNILKARFLIDDDAVKKLAFYRFLILLAIVMIANTQRFEQKYLQLLI